MEASLVGYFELEETDNAEQDTALSKEDVPVDESALTEGDSSPEEAAPTDDSTPLTDAGLTESEPPVDEAESVAIEENAGCASSSEDAASHTASDQTEYGETSEVEEPPEEPTQDTH